MSTHPPVQAIQHHMRGVHETVQRLPGLFEAMLAEDWAAVKKTHEEITREEHVADEMKRAIRHQLPKSNLMPLDRRDLLDVLQMQDKIVKQAKDLAGIILSRKMSLPDKLREPFRNLGQSGVKSIAQCFDVINELDDHLDSGLRVLDVERVETFIARLNELENDTHKLQSELQSALFDHEDEMSPIDVMFTYTMISSIGKIADYAQRIGGRLHFMIAR